jgi:hypothetical protein
MRIPFRWCGLGGRGGGSQRADRGAGLTPEPRLRVPPPSRRPQRRPAPADVPSGSRWVVPVAAEMDPWQGRANKPPEMRSAGHHETMPVSTSHARNGDRRHRKQNKCAGPTTWPAPVPGRLTTDVGILRGRRQLDCWRASCSRCFVPYTHGRLPVPGVRTTPRPRHLSKLLPSLWRRARRWRVDCVVSGHDDIPASRCQPRRYNPETRKLVSIRQHPRTPPIPERAPEITSPAPPEAGAPTAVKRPVPRTRAGDAWVGVCAAAIVAVRRQVRAPKR